MILWVIRSAWIVLPVTSGDTIEAAISDWTGPSRSVAAGLLFASWAIGLLSLLSPRPRAFTALRIVAPALAVFTCAAALQASRPVDYLIAALAVATCIATLSNTVADGCIDAASYGNERRHPLRLPPQFSLVVVPATVVIVISGISTGPMLLANNRALFGAIATVIGLPVAWVGIRSLVSLERRFVVLVPAGIVVSDALTLCDPVLFPTEHVIHIIRSTAIPTAQADAQDGVVDVRLGISGGLEVKMDEPGPFPCRAGRRQTRTINADRLLFAPLRPTIVLDGWTSRARTRHSH